MQDSGFVAFRAKKTSLCRPDDDRSKACLRCSLDRSLPTAPMDLQRNARLPFSNAELRISDLFLRQAKTLPLPESRGTESVAIPHSSPAAAPLPIQCQESASAVLAVTDGTPPLCPSDS